MTIIVLPSANRCLTGPSQRQINRIETENFIRANVGDLHLRYKHNGRQGSAFVRMPDLPEAAAHRSKVRRFN